MKRIALLLVVIIAGFFTGCQKDETSIPLDIEVIQTQLFGLKLPNMDEVKLKSATVNSGDVIYAPMPKYTYKVYNDKAVKYISSIETDNSGYFSRIMTLTQTFSIINGVLSTEHYNLDTQIGCPSSKIFRIKDEPNIDYIWYSAYLYMDDGREFGYFDPNNKFNENHTLELPPVKGGVWKIEVGANSHYMLGKDKYEIFETSLITEELFKANKDNDSEIEVKIILDIKEESNFYLQISKDHELWNSGDSWVESIFLFGDENKTLRLNVSNKGVNGNSMRIFSSPFALNQIVVAYRNESFYTSGGYTRRFNVELSKVENGKTYYRIGEEIK